MKSDMMQNFKELRLVIARKFTEFEISNITRIFLKNTVHLDMNKDVYFLLTGKSIVSETKKYSSQSLSYRSLGNSF